MRPRLTFLYPKQMRVLAHKTSPHKRLLIKGSVMSATPLSTITPTVTPDATPIITTMNPVVPNLVSYDIGQNRRRHLNFMQQTHDTVIHLLTPVSQERATTLRDARDGDKGWTVLEVLCHLRDFDNIFRMRAKIMRYQEFPTLPFYDHEKLAQE